MGEFDSRRSERLSRSTMSAGMNRLSAFAARFLARFQSRYAASGHIIVSGPEPVLLEAPTESDRQGDMISG